MVAKRPAKRGAEETEARVKRFGLQLARTVGGMLRDILTGFADQDLAEHKAQSIRETGAFLGSLMTSLRQAGYDDIHEIISGLYGKELKVVSDYLESIGYEGVFRGADMDMAHTLVELDLDGIDTITESTIGDLKQVVMANVVAGQMPDVNALAEEYGDKIAANIETEVRTGTSRFNRTLTSTKAEELGLDLFLYDGPEDNRMRPFCDKLMSNPEGERIFTRAEIDAMDNGQGTPVMTDGGGYNCRHRWYVLDYEDAKGLGYKGPDPGENDETDNS